MKFTKLATASALGLIASAGASFAAECGDVSIAEMNWASAELVANVEAQRVESLALFSGHGGTRAAHEGAGAHDAWHRQPLAQCERSEAETRQQHGRVGDYEF